MTTIAYRDGVLAADTGSSAGWYREGLFPKIVKNGPILGGASGGAAIAQRFCDWITGGCVGLPDMGDPKGGDGHQAVGYLFTPDGIVIRFDPGLPPMATRVPYYAQGSGGLLALGAMAHGATAEEAVRVAMRHDIGSFGDVTVLRAANGP